LSTKDFKKHIAALSTTRRLKKYIGYEILLNQNNVFCFNYTYQWWNNNKIKTLGTKD
jgi:hypothetical protein